MLIAIYTILVFCVIVAIHEFGHFITAKLMKVTVHEFSIGMGPKIFGFKKSETDYNFRILPIGGYVKLEGEDEESEDPNAFGNKKAWQRLIILAAGAFMNFILGFLIFVILLSSAEGFASNTVDKIIKDSAFEDAGIISGDKIVYMEGTYKTRVHNNNDISYFFYRNTSDKVKITFKRDGKLFVKNISPKYVESEKRKMFGFSSKVIKPTFLSVVEFSYRQCIFTVKIVASSFLDLFRGRVAMSDMSGPVGIVNEIGNAAKRGFEDVLYLAALISINLGVVNLFPLPALDGGRIFFVLLEMIRRKPVDKEKEGMVHFIGFALLLLFMVVITYTDITKLF